MELRFSIPRLCFAYSVQLSWFEFVFSCHGFGSLLTLKLFSNLSAITSKLNECLSWWSLLRPKFGETRSFRLVSYSFLMEVFYEYNQNWWPGCLLVLFSHLVMILDSGIAWNFPVFHWLPQHHSLLVFWHGLPDLSVFSGSCSSSNPLNVGGCPGSCPQASSHLMHVSWII